MITKTIALACLCLSALFGYLYYTQHLKWRSCFNDQGRCFDPQAGVVYHEHSGSVWLILAILTLVASLALFWRLRRSRR